MRIRDLEKEITQIISDLISLGLTIDQNFVSVNNYKLTWDNEKSFSKLLRHFSYQEKYEFLSENRNYHAKLIDGALLQFQYEFISRRKIKSHRLAYYPNLQVSQYEEDSDYYESEFFEYDEFKDIVNNESIIFPIRFDFSISDDKFIEKIHPKSHVHLGEYRDCRIPVNGPITPCQFMNFILRNFYHTVFCEDMTFQAFESKEYFEPNISREENKIMHLKTGR